MGLRNFFNRRKSEEKDIIKRNKDAFGAIGVLELLMAGATVLGTLSGIFTFPALMMMSVPAIVGIKTMSNLKKGINDSKESIKHLEKLEENGVDVSRNHERHLKVNELKEEKSKEDKINDKYTKMLLGGVGAFAIGGFLPIAAPIATPLMCLGYGTMLYGMYKENKSTNNLREIQKEINKTTDIITAANVKQKFIMSEETNATENIDYRKPAQEKTKSYSQETEKIVDKYIEDLAKDSQTENTNNKIR